ncbi:MAG: histidine phosphatase family protein [Deltaproteobacteria bacterium]|nr:histidine phosphatase family protein [Deltaproteobacteria bacterium]
MSRLERIVLLRHGETVGLSSVRYYGATDVALSQVGAEQAVAAARAIGSMAFDLVVASSLQRARRSASIVAEGLTREEIEAQDPALYAEWQERGLEFDFPGGERREDFRARVLAGLERLLDAPVASLLIVAHKGTVRTIAEELSGITLGPDQPELGGFYELTRSAENAWKLAGASR